MILPIVVDGPGQGGVGKTSLLHRLREIAEESGAQVAYVDENQSDVLETMASLARALSSNFEPFKAFLDRFETYEVRRHELEADPETASR